MADGSPEDRFIPKQMENLTFSAPDTGHGDTKKCSGETLESDKVKLSFYTELEPSDSCEKSGDRGVAANRPASDSAVSGPLREKPKTAQDGEDRKKRCFDRYDSSESSDSGVAVLSPPESSNCSSSDITEPRSPRSPESGCSAGEEGGPARMPPWASEPAPPPPRRLAAQPAPTRRPAPLHRRITEYFNHKMKPQSGKREATTPANDDTKRKCLPKNGVTQDLEKYISYLSQTLSPMLDASTQLDRKTVPNGAAKPTDLSKKTTNTKVNGIVDFNKKDNKEINRTNLNGFIEMRRESFPKEKPNALMNGFTDQKKNDSYSKVAVNPSANGIVKPNKQMNRKSSISASSEPTSIKIAPAVPIHQPPKKAKADSTKMNGIVTSTTKLDSRMNGVTCGSNNISLNSIGCKPTSKKETVKKTQIQPAKRTNRKSSACIANSKNLTWSKANNLKQQVQQQKQIQNCVNAAQQHGSPIKTVPEANTAPKMNIPNGVRQVSMTVNGGLSGLNVNNLQNCHQLNIPQACNGTVTSTNLQSFVAVPQNVMLTTLRIPQNGMQTQTMNQQNNMSAFNRSNVNGVNVSNVSSPTKMNGPFVYPFIQNLNNLNVPVVQIPNLMTKVQNFVLPQTSQLAAQRQELQNQQAAQILINGTLLKLANTMNSAYTNINGMNKPVATSQSIPVLNKNVTGISTMGVTVQSKQNYTVNYSHPVLVQQPGFIVTSVPNMNVKETWTYTGTNSATSTSCSNPISHHPSPIITNFSTQTLHASSIPIAPVKPPDNPIQGTEPPSSTVKEEPEMCETTNTKHDMPWLSKTVNNNFVPLDTTRAFGAFAEVNNLFSKLGKTADIINDKKNNKEDVDKEATQTEKEESLRKVEEVAKREETLFTQITVLKDVSSNIQSTVIEANYCSATTESSESGIGTDKSIDSPSDSQTSKECDEDSSLSLSVSVCDEIVTSQKSPILKQPKTLRFPPRNPVKPPSGKRTSSTDTTSTVVLCMWEECKSEFDNDSDLLQHLQSRHVESQAGKENYVCLWQGCKVRGKPSCSRLWLERHALSHGGNKPFKCIVDGCERRFSTQILLERHVNHHFSETSPSSGGNKKTADSAAKLIRRNGKKLRYRRQPWSARMFDFFDAGTMEGLAWRLARCTRWRLGGSCPLREPPGRHTLTLHAALTATRYNPHERRREALLTYYPPHVLEDEWVPEKDVKRIKRVELSELPAATKVRLYDQFTSSYRKTPSPPPVKRETPSPPTPARTLPARHCTSSRLLNNLLKKKEVKSDCSATNVPMIYGDDDKTEKVEVSGAKKRKMGRRHGGNAFWPCGR